jgi:hypothetical protein
MSLLHRAPATTCPQCGHSCLGLVQRALEPLVWSQHCCHVLVDDPWSYYGSDECGCSGELHQQRLLHRPRVGMVARGRLVRRGRRH